MILVLFVFIVLLVVTFVVLLLATRPSRHHKAVQARLGDLGLGDVVLKEKPKSEQLLKPTKRSQFAWLEVLLVRFGIQQRLQPLIEQANSKSTPAKVVLTSAGFAVAAYLVTSLFANLLLIRIVPTVLLAACPTMILRFQRSRRLNAFNDALPDSIDLMARALRAGHSVASAIEVVAQEGRDPVASEFELVYQQQNFGLPFRDALTTMAHRVQSKDLQFVITAMLVQKETGGNLAEILDRTTEVIRERLRIQGEIRIKSAQGRLTGWILSLLPIVMGVLLNFVSHGFEEPLFTEHIGHIMLYVGAGMIMIGSFFIRKIVTIEV